MWQQILKQKDNEIVLYLKLQDSDGDYEPETKDFTDRDDAFAWIKKMAKEINYTVVGSAKEGKVVKMEDGVFQSLASPTMYYVIKLKEEESPSKNYVPDTRQSNTAEGTRNKLEGKFELDERY